MTCVESLHPVPTADALRALWHLVRPGGRLVAVFTNTDGPINDLANWRHGGVHYFGLGEAALNPTLRSLGGVATWRIGGLHLADDQRLEIYDSRRTYDTEPAPYSWVLAARKAG